MKDVIEFLKQLASHNDREWFAAHKDQYLNAKHRFDSLVEELIGGVRAFDDSIGPLTVADCTWRIYRDTRFSADKRPYKDHFGCFFAPGGKKSPFSGYYFQLGLDAESGNASGLIAAGNYYTEPRALKILREDIEADCAKTLKAALSRAKGFSLDCAQMLKRAPKGFPADESYSEYLRYKNFCLVKSLNETYVTSADLCSRLLAEMETTKPFLRFLNRAIQYSIENEN